MDEKHIIENVVFDISFGSEEEALEQQAALAEFVKQRLLAVVERVFDELSASGVVSRIDELELDLGRMPYNGYQNELEARLEAALRAELQSRIPSVAGRSGENGFQETDRAVPRAEADLEQVQYFLTHGNLPWNSALDSDLTIDDLVKAVVGSKGPELADFLRRSAGDRAVVRRVTSQFPEDILAEIAALLAPSLSDTLREILDHLVRIWRDKNRGASPTSTVRRLFWQEIIGELLAVGTTPLTRDELISRTERKIARRDSVSDEVIAGQPGPRAIGGGPDAPGGDQSEMPPHQPSIEPSHEIESMRRRLAAALLSGDAQALERLWPALLREHPSILAEAARHYLRSARIRKNIVGLLPESMLEEILGVLSPGPTSTVQAVVQQSAALVESLLMAASQALPGGDRIRDLVWEHAFAYSLSQDEFAGFDLVSYTKSLIQRAAEEYEVAEYSRLLGGLLESLESQDRSGVPPSTFIPAVRELAGRAADRRTAPEDHEGPASDVLHSYDLYDLLTERLRGTEDLEATLTLTEIVDELTRLYPWQIQKLLREFQSGALSADTAADRLTPEELGRLIQAIISVAERVEGTGYSDLMRAVEAYAGQVRDVGRYYQMVLDYLAQGQLVDFGAIAEADRVPDRPAPTPAMPEESEGPGETSTDALSDFARELTAGTISPLQVSESLGIQELSRLVEALLTAGTAELRGSLAEMLAAISTFEQRAEDPHRFFQQILEHLIEDRAIDLEQIAASAGAPEGPAEPGRPDRPPGEEDRSEELVGGYDLYQQLRDRLTQPLTRAEEAPDADIEPTAGLIDQLARTHPERIQQLFREFQAGEITAAQASAGLSAEDLQHLVRAFLAVDRQPGDEGPPELLATISAFGQRAEDPHRFYQQILEHLIEDRAIDLEQIAASAGAPEGPAEPGRPDRPPGEEDRSEELVGGYHLYQQLRDRLTQPLTRAEEAPDADIESTVRLIDELARAHPDRLQQLFREFQSGEITASLVSAGLSAEDLQRLVRAFIAVNLQPGDDGPPDLLDAIQAFAQQAVDAHRFYSQLLDILVQDLEIDLEALAAGDAISPDTGGAEQPARLQLPAPEPGLEAGTMAERDAVQSLSDYLRGGEAPAGTESALLIRSSESLLTAQSRPLRQLFERELDSRDAASRLVRLLPDRLLMRVLHLARPSEHYRIQRTADILADALYAKELGLSADRMRDLKWRSIFQYVFDRGLPFQETGFVEDFIEFIAGQPGLPAVAELRGILGRQMALNILPSTRQLQLPILWAVTRGAAQAGDASVSGRPASPATGPAAEAADLRPSGRDKEAGASREEERPAGDIYIANAGVVLAASYLQRLFDMLGLIEGPAFKDAASAVRGVHLLQFMVDESTASPEHLLVLNKIMCGVRTGIPIVREIDITDREKEAVEGLIQGMIQNWTALGNTSVAGFRESFLQREGRLRLDNNAWHLLVEPRAYDMLLDRIPWGFSTIRLPWMERVIYVDWR